MMSNRSHALKCVGYRKEADVKFIGVFISIIGSITLALIYFGVVTPVGYFLRLFGRDLLKLNFIKKSSYWVSRRELNKPNFFKRQF